MSIKYDVVIVGGGLAGLTSAARLSKNNKKVLLLERGQLGGRALTMELKGYKFNFGAHAVYGRDTSIIKELEKELGLEIEWKDFSKSKAKYDLGSELSEIPTSVLSLMQTKMVKKTGKVQFAWEVLKTMIHAEKGHPHISIKNWLDEKGYREDVKDMMLTLASSNFFTREPDRIPSDVFFNYYKRIFKTNKPVSYIQGGWQVIIDELVRVIEENGGEIKTKTKIKEVDVKDNKVNKITDAKDNYYEADDFIFCIPPKELGKIFEETKIDNIVKQYISYLPSYVMFYDIGLKNRVSNDYTYIYDKENSVFITDISYYDPKCTPKGGQMLQAVAYLKSSDVGDKEKFEEYKGKVEKLYDKHFKGWRDELIVPRISKKAVVQEIKWTMEQEPMPIFFPDYRNLFFAGDWCQGNGQLSELSFSSAYKASEYILEK